jgi:hypothetical protein
MSWGEQLARLVGLGNVSSGKHVRFEVPASSFWDWWFRDPHPCSAPGSSACLFRNLRCSCCTNVDTRSATRNVVTFWNLRARVAATRPVRKYSIWSQISRLENGEGDTMLQSYSSVCRFSLVILRAHVTVGTSYYCPPLHHVGLVSELETVRSVVLAAVAVKDASFWDVIPCNILHVYRRFGGKHCRHFQVQREANQIASRKQIKPSVEDVVPR